MDFRGIENPQNSLKGTYLSFQDLIPDINKLPSWEGIKGWAFEELKILKTISWALKFSRCNI